MTAEKVQIVRENTGIQAFNTTLSAIGLPKTTWLYWMNEKVCPEGRCRQSLCDIVRERPGYGYWRVYPQLNARRDSVGEWTVRRGLQMWNLSLRRAVKPPKLSMPRQILNKKGLNLVQGLDDVRPFEVLVTDFAAVRYDSGRKKATFMPLLDRYAKWVVGWSAGRHRDTQTAEQALTMTKRRSKEMGHSLEGRIVHHNQDPVYAGYRWWCNIPLSYPGHCSSDYSDPVVGTLASLSHSF